MPQGPVYDLARFLRDNNSILNNHPDMKRHVKKCHEDIKIQLTDLKLLKTPKQKGVDKVADAFLNDEDYLNVSGSKKKKSKMKKRSVKRKKGKKSGKRSRRRRR